MQEIERYIPLIVFVGFALWVILRSNKAQKTATERTKGILDSSRVHFSEAMDYGSMQIGFKLTGPGKEKITGIITPANDKSWSFTHDSLWKPGIYQLELNDYITDLSGNHLVRKFEETREEAINKRHSLFFSIDSK